MKELKAMPIIAWVCGRGQGGGVRGVRVCAAVGLPVKLPVTLLTTLLATLLASLLASCAGLGSAGGDGSGAGRAAGGVEAAPGAGLAVNPSKAPAEVPAGGLAVPKVAEPAVQPAPSIWRAVSAGPLETWTERRTPLYTYVLAGDIARPPVASAATASPASPGLPTSKGPKARAQRVLQRLLRDVQADAFPEGPEADVALAAAHQFLIPAWPRTARSGGVAAGEPGQAPGRTAGAEEALTLADVDLIKARAHLDVLRVVLGRQPQMAQRLRGLGPFLVTTRQPLGELVRRAADGKLVVVDRSPVMLIDLGGHNDSTVLATVKTLKVVAREAPGQTGAIGPLRARMISKLRATGVVLPDVAESPAPPAAPTPPAASGRTTTPRH